MLLDGGREQCSLGENDLRKSLTAGLAPTERGTLTNVMTAEVDRVCTGRKERVKTKTCCRRRSVAGGLRVLLSRVTGTRRVVCFFRMVQLWRVVFFRSCSSPLRVLGCAVLHCCRPSSRTLSQRLQRKYLRTMIWPEGCKRWCGKLLNKCRFVWSSASPVWIMGSVATFDQVALHAENLPGRRSHLARSMRSLCLSCSPHATHLRTEGESGYLADHALRTAFERLH